VAAELLRAHGITVFSDGQIPQLLAWMAQRAVIDKLAAAGGAAVGE
jgi:hypothetical protein